ncbi:MAG: YaiO family outer membrane beta-barrel protein [Firmicutes bacterium]|nr:YaiO family outer membrane beta-barrel protein [Bacillota bacterium]
MFARARTLAFSGHREQALALCRQALERSPNYQEIRVFAARVLSWEKRYDEGRALLHETLRKEPDHLDARMALADLELWSDHPRAAVDVCEEGLRLHPQNMELWLRKARGLRDLERYEEALEAAKQVMHLDPDRHEARRLMEDITELARRNKLSFGFTYDRFDRTFDPWQLFTLQTSHRFNFGSLIARINRAQRFGDTGHQFEMDAYPRWGDGTYFYLNAGFSGDGIFPRQRYGAEIYRNFPGGIEGSLGLRNLRFSSSSVTIQTGSIGKYWRDYFFSLRLNHTPSSIGASNSGSFLVRRYFSDRDTYVGIVIGSGVSPDQPNPNSWIINLRSKRVGISGQGWVIPRLLLSGSVSYERQEIDTGVERGQTTLAAGVEWRF